MSNGIRYYISCLILVPRIRAHVFQEYFLKSRKLENCTKHIRNIFFLWWRFNQNYVLCREFVQVKDESAHLSVVWKSTNTKWCQIQIYKFSVLLYLLSSLPGWFSQATHKVTFMVTWKLLTVIDPKRHHIFWIYKWTLRIFKHYSVKLF